MNETTPTTPQETPDLPTLAAAPDSPENPIDGFGMLDMWLDPEARKNAFNSAQLMSDSDFVPKQYQGKPGNVMVAFEIADMLQVRPVIVMQNLNVIHGNPSFKTTFLTVLANRNGKFAHPIRYIVEGEGKSLKVTAWSTMADTGERVEAFASMEMAEIEGWTNNKKYRSMPEHMLHFRSATFLVRRYNPEALFGFSFNDELEDVSASRRPTPRVAAPSSAGVSNLNSKVSGAAEAEPADAEIIPPNESQDGAPEQQGAAPTDKQQEREPNAPDRPF